MIFAKRKTTFMTPQFAIQIATKSVLLIASKCIHVFAINYYFNELLKKG